MEADPSIDQLANREQRLSALSSDEEREEKHCHALEKALQQEQALTEAVLDAAGSLVMVVDRYGRILRFNRTCEYITGYTQQEVQGRLFWELFLPPERIAVVQALFATFDKGIEKKDLSSISSVEEIEDRNCHSLPHFDNYWVTRTGSRRLIAWSYNQHVTAGEWDCVIGMGNDLTARKEAEETVARLSQQTELILNSAGDGIFGLDQRGAITFINPAAAQMLGVSTHAVIGKPHQRVLYGAGAGSRSYQSSWQIAAALQDGEVHRADDATFCRADGTTIAVEYSSNPIRDTSGIALGRDYEIVGAVITFHDITERKRAQEALQHLALHDTLTDLPNRTLLRDRLGQAIRSAHRHQQQVALLLIDLDRFKEINDTLGHHTGDLLLQQVAARLRQALRADDTVARLGGDEFALVLPNTDTAGAEYLATKLLTVLTESYWIEGQHLSVGASIGIALYPVHSADEQGLLRQADVAMYVAKRSRLGYQVYVPEHDEHSPARLALLHALRDAIEQGQMVLHYQPKLNLTTNAIEGVEALARWMHPEHGIIPPDQFVPMAETTGLIGPLTLCVIEAAIRQLHEWLRVGRQMAIAINLSMWNLHDPELPATIEGFLRQFQVPAQLLRIELTESTVMQDSTRSLGMLNRLRKLGLHLSIDDFGTGYTSLTYLKRLPVDEIKIDTSFVLHMTEDDADAAITSAIIGLGHSFEAHVVAEGVENQRTQDLLQALGCDSVQGFHICRPLPIEKLDAWLNCRAPMLALV